MTNHFFEIKLHKRIYQAMKIFLPSLITTKENIGSQFLSHQVLRITFQGLEGDILDQSKISLIEKTKSKIVKALKEMNILKIDISQKTLARVLHMKQWKSQVKGQNVTIISQKKPFGNLCYLAGITSLKNLNKIATQFQSRGFKKFLTKYKNNPQNMGILQKLIKNSELKTRLYEVYNVSDLDLWENSEEHEQSYIKLKCQIQSYISTKELTQVFHNLVSKQFCSLTFILQPLNSFLLKKQIQIQYIHKVTSQAFSQKSIQSQFFPIQSDKLWGVRIIGFKPHFQNQKQFIIETIIEQAKSKFKIMGIKLSKGFKIDHQLRLALKQRIQQEGTQKVQESIKSESYWGSSQKSWNVWHADYIEKAIAGK